MSHDIWLLLPKRTTNPCCKCLSSILFLWSCHSYCIPSPFLSSRFALRNVSQPWNLCFWNWLKMMNEMKKIMCMLSHLCKLRDKLIGIQMVSKHQNPNMTSCNFCRNKDTACNSELSNSSQNLFNTLGIEPLAFLSSRLNFRRCFCSIDSFLYGDFFLWCWNFFRDRSLQIGFKTNFRYKSIFFC